MQNETVVRRQQFKNIPKTRKKEKFYVEIKDYIKKKKIIKNSRTMLYQFFCRNLPVLSIQIWNLSFMLCVLQCPPAVWSTEDSVPSDVADNMQRKKINVLASAKINLEMQVKGILLNIIITPINIVIIIIVVMEPIRKIAS